MPRIQKYKLIKNKFMMKKITLFIFLLTASFAFAHYLVKTVTVRPGTTSGGFAGAFW